MTKISKAERENAAALVESGLEAKTVAALYGVSPARIYQIVRASQAATCAAEVLPDPLPDLPPPSAVPAVAAPASRRAPVLDAPLRLPLAKPARCGTADCRSAAQPGRDRCATCLAEALRPNRRSHMI